MTLGETTTDAHMMRRCVELAGQARGRTAPNPMVGAVLVKDGRIVAEGWHRAPGLAHAEVDALSRLDQGQAQGATMYVNLEPCCHHGRTPPCTDAILSSGVRRVVVGMVDPDPRVRGQGLEILRRAGLDVSVGVEETACRQLNLGFIRAIENGRPLVLLKAGVSLDGRIADAWGRSQWITSPQARAAGHRLRNSVDAVLVGSGTLLADDPALTTRGLDDGRDALPVVLDSQLRCPQDAKILRGPRRPLIFCADDAPTRDLPADIVSVGRSDRGLDLAAVLSELVQRGIHSILVEGGGQVHRSFLDQGLVDYLHLFMAPVVLAGGPAFLGGPAYRLEDALRLRLLRAQAVGPDLHVELAVDAATDPLVDQGRQGDSADGASLAGQVALSSVGA